MFGDDIFCVPAYGIGDACVPVADAFLPTGTCRLPMVSNLSSPALLYTSQLQLVQVPNSAVVVYLTPR